MNQQDSALNSDRTRDTSQTASVVNILSCIGPNDEYYETLVNDQLDAKLLYFIIRLLQSSTCFEQRRAHHQEVELY